MTRTDALDDRELDKLVVDHPHPCDEAIPPVLQASVARHQANLARLLQSLRQAGMEPRQIEAAVTTVIDSYKSELLEAIRRLAADNNAPGESR
jgi:hypothetical protein